MNQSSNWVKVHEAFDGISAELLKNYLVQEHDIDAVVLNKQDSSYHIGKFEIHVPKESATKAEEIILEFNQQKGE